VKRRKYSKGEKEPVLEKGRHVRGKVKEEKVQDSEKESCPAFTPATGWRRKKKSLTTKEEETGSAIGVKFAGKNAQGENHRRAGGKSATAGSGKRRKGEGNRSKRKAKYSGEK